MLRQADGLLEDEWGIVANLSLVLANPDSLKTDIRDQIDSRNLLHELASDTEHFPIDEALLAILQNSQLACASRGLTFFFYGTFDLIKPVSEPGMLFCNGVGIPLDEPQNVACFVEPATRNKL